MGVTLLHDFKNIFNWWIVFCNVWTLIYYIYPRITTKVNVSATVGMSATVGEMSATVGEMFVTVGDCPQQWGNIGNRGKIEYGLGNLRVSLITLHRLPLRIHGITCKSPIRI